MIAEADAMVSVITPTFDRAAMLPRAYSVFASQHWPLREWIVIDDSAAPSPFMRQLVDPRVIYVHLDERLSTGMKRNMAIDLSSGSIIAQFDDDDYYCPNYLAHMCADIVAGRSDFCKLAKWFVYHSKTETLGYWDSRSVPSVAFEFHPKQPVQEVHISDSQIWRDNLLGYGFSYVFRKTVWSRSEFPDQFWGQDLPFIKAAIANNFRLNLIDDIHGVCLHIIHEANASKSYPQHLLPDFVLPTCFPGFDDYMAVVGDETNVSSTAP